MQYLHFLWWGPFRPSSCDTPLAVAQASPQVKVVFWCKRSEVAAHARAMQAATNIEVRECDSVRDIVGADLVAGSEKEWFDLAQRVVQLMNWYNAFAAVKDLLSLLILSTWGGYFMDTTMVITDPRLIQSNLLVQTPHARTAQCPVGSNHIQAHVPMIMDPRALTVGWNKAKGDNVVTDPLVRHEPSIEVWCMYGPGLGDLAGAPRVDRWKASGMAVAIRGYLSRARMMGLCNGAPADSLGRRIMTRPRPVPPGRAPTEAEMGLARQRNTLIGQIAVQSVKDGMLSQQVADYSIRYDPVLYKKPNPVAGGPLISTYKGVMRGWGMEKHYAGSWRGATAPEAAFAAASSEAILATANPGAI